MRDPMRISLMIEGRGAQLHVNGSLELLGELLRAIDREPGDMEPAREAALPAMLAAEATKLKGDARHA